MSFGLLLAVAVTVPVLFLSNAKKGPLAWGVPCAFVRKHGRLGVVLVVFLLTAPAGCFVASLCYQSPLSITPHTKQKQRKSEREREREKETVNHSRVLLSELFVLLELLSSTLCMSFVALRASKTAVPGKKREGQKGWKKSQAVFLRGTKVKTIF